MRHINAYMADLEASASAHAAAAVEGEGDTQANTNGGGGDDDGDADPTTPEGIERRRELVTREMLVNLSQVRFERSK
jgi:hypothetical protein